MFRGCTTQAQRANSEEYTNITDVIFMDITSGPFFVASYIAAPVIPQPANAPAPPHHSAEFQKDFDFVADEAEEEEEEELAEEEDKNFTLRLIGATIRLRNIGALHRLMNVLNILFLARNNTN